MKKLATVTATPRMMLVNGVVLRTIHEISTWKKMIAPALRLIRYSGLICPFSSRARSHEVMSMPTTPVTAWRLRHRSEVST